MKVGMNLLLWTDAPTRKHAFLVENLKKWGFDGVEFPIGGMADEDIRYFSQLCDDLGMGRSVIFSLDAAAADPAHPDPKFRAAAVAEMKKAVDRTVALGSDLIVGPLFQGLGRFTGQAPTADEWQRSTEAIREAAEYAQTAGVRFALEPINRFEMYMVNTLADGARFVEQVGMRNVGLLADTHHGNIEENHTASAWKQVAEHIFHVHISENHRGTPGSGQAIPADIFDTLKEIGYDGWLTIEAFGRQVPGLISRLHLWRSFARRDDDIAIEGNKFIRKHLR